MQNEVAHHRYRDTLRLGYVLAHAPPGSAHYIHSAVACGVCVCVWKNGWFWVSGGRSSGRCV
jgi:hypothetical protein